ncbi:MAG: DUF4252 domain-containing protein [Bacteroidaceae bacterium]|nr:DUF4252 domain-containing protein [Bacteroidaceae bacterium]
MMKVILMIAVLFASMTMQAQDELFRKYTDMDDITTKTVGKASLQNLPFDQINVPGLKNMIDRIEAMTILISTGDRAGKNLGTKLPSQLKGKGFKVMQETKLNGQNVTVLQSKKDPSKVAIIVYQKPHATAVYMEGNFEDLESDFSGMIQ